MGCYRPLSGYRSESGSVSIGYARGAEAPNSKLSLPCGRCVGCRLERAEFWTMRCVHEASFWDHNQFVTLTYDDEHLPAGGSLSSDDVTRFVKRFRRRVGGVSEGPRGDRPVRYLLAGEYGGVTGRPHYHLLLFNVRLVRGEPSTKHTYRSEQLSELWKLGASDVGDFSAATAAYVSQYALKKQVTRRLNASESVDLRTGELVTRAPEFVHMSRSPGLGSMWFDRYQQDLKHGYLVHDGKKCRIPRYYRTKLMEDPHFAELDSERQAEFLYSLDPAERTEDRLLTREVVTRSRRALFSSPRGL